MHFRDIFFIKKPPNLFQNIRFYILPDGFVESHLRPHTKKINGEKKEKKAFLQTISGIQGKEANFINWMVVFNVCN